MKYYWGRDVKRERLSIAMCTYNGARHLQEQLDSFKSQTRMPDELVVCDDVSTDETVEIVEAFASEAPFNVRLYVNEKNLGSTKNFEKAIAICEGDIIFLSDQDDVWLPDKLSKVAELLTQFPEVAGVLTDAEIVDESLNLLGFYFWQATRFKRRQQGRAMKGKLGTLVKHNSSMSGATFAFRAKLRDIALPIPEYWTHDAWIILIIAALAKLVVLPEQLNLWRQHELQQLGSWKKKSLLEMRDMSLNKEITEDALFAAKQYESAKERIEAMNFTDSAATDTKTKLLARLKEKSVHLQARSKMSTARIKRIPSILNELMSMRYFRYSSGFKSAVRDFFIS